MTSDRQDSASTRAGDSRESLFSDNQPGSSVRATESWQSWLDAAPTPPADPALTDAAPDNDQGGAPTAGESGAAGPLLPPERWLDTVPVDPMAELKEDMRRRAAAKTVRRRRRRIVAAAGGACTFLAIICGGWAVITHGSGSTEAGVDDTTTLVPATAPASPTWCQPVDTATRTVGSGAGNLDTPIGVILWQQYQWYVRRDAEAARSVLAPGAIAAPLEAAIAAVAAIPPDTRHCVTITPTDEPSHWNVAVEERYLGGGSATWAQKVATEIRDGRVLITSITAGGS